MGKKIYVGNLSFNSSESGITELFSKFGEVVSARLITDRDTGRSKGFAFVEMGTAEEAADAISNLDGNDFDGRNIRVNEAIEKERSGGGGGRGGNRGGGGGRRW